MRRFGRKNTRTVRRLAKALAALDEQAGAVRPRPQRVVRSSVVPVR